MTPGPWCPGLPLRPTGRAFPPRGAVAVCGVRRRSQLRGSAGFAPASLETGGTSQQYATPRVPSNGRGRRSRPGRPRHRGGCTSPAPAVRTPGRPFLQRATRTGQVARRTTSAVTPGRNTAASREVRPPPSTITWAAISSASQAPGCPWQQTCSASTTPTPRSARASAVRVALRAAGERSTASRTRQDPAASRSSPPAVSSPASSPSRPPSSLCRACSARAARAGRERPSAAGRPSPGRARNRRAPHR